MRLWIIEKVAILVIGVMLAVTAVFMAIMDGLRYLCK